MRYRVAVEDIEPNHYVSWVLDLPGCFRSARNQQDAVTDTPSRIADYYAWAAKHDPSLPTVSGPFGVAVVEVFKAHASDEDPDYLVNGFFEDDRRPLSFWDVEVGLRLLRWSRQDLLEVARPLLPGRVCTPIGDEVYRRVRGILEHVARAENWYLGQFDLAVERSTLPEHVLGKLETVRANTRGQLIKLMGEDRLTENRGEKWSARKVLRRTLWHERDHTQHIARLASRVG
jgi:hypothetical protein